MPSHVSGISGNMFPRLAKVGERNIFVCFLPVLPPRKQLWKHVYRNMFPRFASTTTITEPWNGPGFLYFDHAHFLFLTCQPPLVVSSPTANFSCFYWKMTPAFTYSAEDNFDAVTIHPAIREICKRNTSSFLIDVFLGVKVYLSIHQARSFGPVRSKTENGFERK